MSIWCNQKAQDGKLLNEFRLVNLSWATFDKYAKIKITTFFMQTTIYIKFGQS